LVDWIGGRGVFVATYAVEDAIGGNAVLEFGTTVRGVAVLIK